MKSILLGIAIVYFAVVGGMFFAQRSFLYFPDKSFPEELDSDDADSGFMRTNTGDGLTIIGWYHRAQPGKKTIVYFHGNGGHIGYRLPLMTPYIAQGYGVLMAGYRGYGGNEGRPSEQGLYSDARAYLDFLMRGRKIAEKDIVLYGESLGSGVAVQMALEHPGFAAMLLVTPITGTAPVAKKHYPWLPVGLLLRDRFNNLSKIASVTTMPSYYFIAGRDTVVPPDIAAALYDAAPGPKARYDFPDGGHNDLLDHGLTDKVLEVLDAL